MKRIIALVLGLIVISTLGACSSEPSGAFTGTLPPTIIIDDRNYLAPNMPVNELPDGYEYIGDLSREEANNTGLEGCQMYAFTEDDSLNDFYLYQKCGTPISKDTVDNTRIQWAYVQWTFRE